MTLSSGGRRREFVKKYKHDIENPTYGEGYMSPLIIDEVRNSDSEIEVWLTAAVPMENPYCGCKLTRARAPAVQRCWSRSSSRSGPTVTTCATT